MGFVLSALAAALLWLAGGPALAQGTCPGRDLLPDLAERNPAAHRRVTAAAAGLPHATAVFWKIERHGLPVSWLLGTIHMADERVATLSPAVKDALRSARAVALEVADLAPDAMARAMARTPERFVFQDGRSLAQLLSRDDMDAAVAALEASGIPRSMAQIIRPWLAFTVMSMSSCERARTSRGERVLDQRIADEARAFGIPVSGLETIESQLAAMASLPEAQQLGMLKAAVAYASRSNDVGETLIQIYLKRQLGLAWPLQIALAEEAGVGPESFAGFESDLIIARNRHMAAEAGPLLRDGGVFIAVGSLHLVGHHGLVALLQRDGYTLTAVD